MAIDTRNKRASVIRVFMPGRIHPNPDGTLANANDRTHMVMRYAGITSATETGNKVPWHIINRRTI